MSDYAVIVIGGGSPGEHCVGALAEGGLRVALLISGASAGMGAVYADRFARRGWDLVLAARDRSSQKSIERHALKRKQISNC